ncbi:glycosyltransferase [Flavobacterium jejuense]|uniref:Glycosyltransferase n=1 Tax=Flavobacterium jejuense TaxID=1544455 RepID=A0ABX0IQM4_9FLAO|nr:glycosyltransferase [Flavobacterium jejuense]NHN26152.1 glycosyltransferase [Flavobacterium jejuense]
MKILRVINSLNIGGAERSIAGNVPLHVMNGFEMDVLLLDGNQTFFVEELKKNGIKVTWFGVNNFIYNPFFVFKISKIINNYDVVHAHLFPSLYWVALAKIVTRSKVKLIYTEHSTYNKRRDYFFLKWIDQFIYNKYDKIIAISKEATKALSKHIMRTDIITIPNGVDLSKVKEESKIVLNDLSKKYIGKKIIVQVAGFRISKDQDTVINCLALLPNKYVVLFVGDGERIEICKALVEKLNVSDRIEFLGLQNNIGAILNLADVVVMSSHWEGFGRAAIEGMALGKPVIATNVSGLADVVKDAGLLFEKGNVNQLKELILKLELTDFYALISKKCEERAEEYNIKKMIDSYEDIYKALI